MEIRVNEEDYFKLLEELKHKRQQVTDLQQRGTELLLENRELRSANACLNAELGKCS